MISLRQLDGKRVAVSIPVKEPPIWVCGLATFQSDSKVPQLKIAVDDSTGGFDILIKESEWTGAIEPCTGNADFEFLIRLTVPGPLQG